MLDLIYKLLVHFWYDLFLKKRFVRASVVVASLVYLIYHFLSWEYSGKGGWDFVESSLLPLALIAFIFGYTALLHNQVLDYHIKSLKEVVTLIERLPTISRELSAIAVRILEILIKATAGSVFGGEVTKDSKLNQWRASILVYDGHQLVDYALVNYPPNTKLAFVSSVCWKIFVSRDSKESACTFPGDLDKHADFVREAINFPEQVVPSRSMACVRIESEDGYRFGTLQVASPKRRVFDHKKIKQLMQAFAEVIIIVLMKEPGKRPGEMAGNMRTYIFE